MGMLWCMYVELRIYRNYKRMVQKAGVEIFPWLVEVIMVLCNLFGTGIMFKISGENVYQRTAGVLVDIFRLSYICLQYLSGVSFQKTRG